MWQYGLSRIWRNLHRDIEIDRNRRSQELLKLGGDQKTLIFRGEGLPYEGKVRKFLNFYFRGWRGGGRGGGSPMRRGVIL